MARQFDDLSAKLTSFSDRNLIAPNGTAPANAPDAILILQVLPKGLASLRDVLDNTQQFASAWKSMQPVLSALPSSATPAAAKDPDAERKNLQATVDGIKLSLAGWLTTVGSKVSADTQALDGQISPVLTDPAKNSAAAAGAGPTRTGSGLEAASKVAQAVSASRERQESTSSDHTAIRCPVAAGFAREERLWSPEPGSAPRGVEGSSSQRRTQKCNPAEKPRTLWVRR